jgi:LmbE family N-acetylglucosaminyl deacetylase
LPAVKILHLSDGAALSQEELEVAGSDTNAEYVARRREECAEALALANVEPSSIENRDFAQGGLAYSLVDSTKLVLEFLRKTSPRAVITHAYEGGHPDHDAAAFSVHWAACLLRDHGLEPPTIFEMAVYPGGNGQSKVPEFLHSPSRESTTLLLDAKANDLKARMFACLKTQSLVLANSPLGPEKFRQAPAYDFRLPPHLGKLHYEEFPWSMTGKEWRWHAREAVKKLLPPSKRALFHFSHSMGARFLSV